MRYKRLLMVILVLLIVLALAVPALSQLEPDMRTGMPPVTFILDNMLDAHEQDIKERMFEYKFEAASDDPEKQAGLVQARSDELKEDIASEKGFLVALMARNALVPDGQFIALVDDVNMSIGKIGGWSEKLEEHAEGLNANETYTGSVESLISDVNDAGDLASRAMRSAKG